MNKLFYSLLILSVCFTVSYADYFYLKSGKVINGKIISEADDSVTVSVTGTGVKRKIMLYEIEEITKKPRPLPAVTTKAAAAVIAEKAKTQFTSDLKQDNSEGETYVKDNKSGVLVYNVQEAVIEKPKTASSSDNEFDAALFLLGDSSTIKTSSSSESKTTTTAKKGESKPEVQKRVKEKPAAIRTDDENFDAALFLLGDSSTIKTSSSVASNNKSKTMTTAAAKKRESKPKVQKRVKEKPAAIRSNDEEFDAALFLLSSSPQPPASVTPTPQEKKEKVPTDDYYDAALFLLGEQSAGKPAEPETTTFKYKEPKEEKRLLPKPESETFLALAFDLKGINIFSGEVKNSGVKNDAHLTENVDYGISLSAEQYGYVSRFAAVGLGLGFQFKRALEESPGRFSFLPLYAAFKMRFFSEEDYHFYAVGHLGYNFLIANFKYLDKNKAEGGLYYAAGLGASYNRYVFQILYSVNNASLHYSNSSLGNNSDIDVMYSKVGFYIGYIL
ncbi:MAG: hypothetical protein LBD46_06930 [Endomicrobium sp.]|jgi:hypothetical protein|nr:hypothetical protein [Endomicrobium sp.]